MGLNDSDTESEIICRFYHQYTQKAKKLDSKNYDKAFDKLAEEIYVALETFKKCREEDEELIQTENTLGQLSN